MGVHIFSIEYNLTSFDTKSLKVNSGVILYAATFSKESGKTGK